MKEENKRLIKRLKFSCIAFMAMLLIVALTGLLTEGVSATISYLVVIALCGFLPMYLILTRVLKSES